MIARIFPYLAMSVVVFMPRIAAADSIDGNWCSTDGRHFEIAGSQIVTWGGTRMNGDYDRHGFRYVVPGTEKGAGARIDMRLMGEHAVYVTTDGAAPQTWNRCAKPTS